MSTKNIWRARMLTARSELGPDKISQYNREICKNLSFVWVEGGGLNAAARGPIPREKRPLWLGYKSFRWEANPEEAILQSSPYLRWAFPKVVAQDHMEFFEPLETDALWIKNSWGLWEPDSKTALKVNIDECAGILVPGVAFDLRGHRLGYGKGFYDRALASFKGLKVGVGFSAQMIAESIPDEASDVAMDLIVTDKEILRVAGEQGTHD